MRYAEVIGDPVRHSKSPTIHKYWLKRLNLSGDYRRTLVSRSGLADFLLERREDPDWLGCNVTIPHKEACAALVDRLDSNGQIIGAINCVVPREGGSFGTNSDVEGVAAALDNTALAGGRAVIIGGGGAARAAITYLAGRKMSAIQVLVRDSGKAQALRASARGTAFEAADLSRAAMKLKGAAVIINASPLGMRGSPPMPDELIAAIARDAGDSTLFDMVYDPLETHFLAIGRAAGARVVDGLTMLMGQAARAFELFFGETPPEPDEELRALLSTDRRNST